MQILPGHTVGIDLGTTYSAIAQLDADGNPVSLTNSDGKTITPSVVLLGEDGKVIVGPTFERMSIENPQNIVEAIKRQMGNKDFHIVYQGKKLTPEFISALIIKKLKQDAEKSIGPIANAVVTVPYYFNDVRRKATQDAGKIAGLNVIDIINEPTAATLAYAWQKGQLGRSDNFAGEKTIMVYDLGGGTFDVTVVRYNATNFKVLATDGDVMLGGLDWSRRIVDHISEQFHKQHGMDPREDPETMMTLTQECEQAKRDLSDKAQLSITAYYKGKNTTVALTRQDFERMTADLMLRTRDTTELVMQQAGVGKGELDEVVLVGGSTYMPVVETMLREVTGKAPSRDVTPEEAVAEGAAIHAAILEARATGGNTRMGQAVVKRLQSVQASDVNSHSLGVKITDPNNRTRKINHIMIPKNTSIPFKTTQRFVTNSPNQQRVHVCILEGDALDPDACTTIGDFRVVGLPPNLPAGSPIEITYEYDKNGRFAAHARELVGNTEAKTEIVRDSGLTDADTDAFENLARDYKVE
ncbi:MAG: Hsp70 family protein [Planctomycetaceae bacterium]|nr:Hsp70 family protein [Planctomycetaceae bacterium]MCB9951943.1 Hsp70 family protein [Planctomycetaceae bacterium]